MKLLMDFKDLPHPETEIARKSIISQSFHTIFYDYVLIAYKLYWASQKNHNFDKHIAQSVD